MVELKDRVAQNIGALWQAQQGLMRKINDQEALLLLIRDSNRIVAEIEGAPRGESSPTPQSCIEFSMQEELNRLHFQLDELLALRAKLANLKTRSCSTCKGIGTITYTPDGMDQVHPVTTVCPTCRGVSINTPTPPAPQPNGC